MQKVQPGELLKVLVVPGEARDAVVVEARKQSDKETDLVQLRTERVTAKAKDRGAKKGK